VPPLILKKINHFLWQITAKSGKIRNPRATNQTAQMNLEMEIDEAQIHQAQEVRAEAETDRSSHDEK
jgi:hypothetical protein